MAWESMDLLIEFLEDLKQNTRAIEEIHTDVCEALRLAHQAAEEANQEN